MKKIIDADMLRMVDEGTPQKDIAVFFGVTESAISKQLKRLRQITTRPEILDKLTSKEERFVYEIVKEKTQTQAALASFDVGSLDSAKSIGCSLMKNGDIQAAITAVMETEGLTRRHLVRKLKSHVDGVDPNVSLRAVDMGLKLHDAFPATKSLNISANFECDPVDLSQFRLR